ncbi:hypothetical protein BDF14DRAFT_101782 [Spinellus fusiger]|nr:hypothetical protein BDF14DRAFT_101782 [Spinellus fusiger]
MDPQTHPLCASLLCVVLVCCDHPFVFPTQPPIHLPNPIPQKTLSNVRRASHCRCTPISCRVAVGGVSRKHKRQFARHAFLSLSLRFVNLKKNIKNIKNIKKGKECLRLFFAVEPNGELQVIVGECGMGTFVSIIVLYLHTQT